MGFHKYFHVFFSSSFVIFSVIFIIWDFAEGVKEPHQLELYSKRVEKINGLVIVRNLCSLLDNDWRRLVFRQKNDDYYFFAFSDVYVAAALMEYFCTKDKKIASNIFELGFKKYKEQVGFVSHYLDFLIHLNGILLFIIRINRIPNFNNFPNNISN